MPGLPSADRRRAHIEDCGQVVDAQACRLTQSASNGRLREPYLPSRPDEFAHLQRFGRHVGYHSDNRQKHGKICLHLQPDFNGNAELLKSWQQSGTVQAWRVGAGVEAPNGRWRHAGSVFAGSEALSPTGSSTGGIESMDQVRTG
jgi:hypothetical protein